MATRTIFETDLQVRNTLTNVQEFANTVNLKDGFKGAAAAIQVAFAELTNSYVYVMQQEQLQQRLDSVFSCFERARLESDDVQCRQLILLAYQEEAALKEIVSNLTAGQAACVLLKFQMKAQESLVNIERGLSIMRQELNAKLDVMDSKIDVLLGRDVLEHMRLQARRFLDGFPRLAGKVYVESMLLDVHEHEDTDNKSRIIDTDNKSKPAMRELRCLWEKRQKSLMEIDGSEAEDLHDSVPDSVLITGFAGILFA